MDIWQWLGGADNVTATLLALAAIVAGVWTFLRRTLFKRRLFKRKLDSLAIGVNHEYVASLLGPPAFGRLDDAGCGSLLWASAHAYVDVLFDAGAAVQLAVTVTDPWLQYDVGSLTFGVLRGRLGREVKADSEPEGRYLSIGARRAWCVLTYYGGNPGGYYLHSVAYNDASILGRFPTFLTKEGRNGYWDGNVYGGDAEGEYDPMLAHRIDAELIPNTVIVSRDVEPLQRHEFGVDLDGVRHLRHGITWAERIRAGRYVRGWKRQLKGPS